jgi:hypothetical protein
MLGVGGRDDADSNWSMKRQGITVYRAIDSREEAELPLRTGVTRFLPKPYI